MKCPVCSHNLVEYNAGDFRVDICRDGCSGIWFDKAEFEKCDQHSEHFPADILRVRKVANVVIDRSKIRNCPRCTNVKLARVVLDRDKNFEIDSCQTCFGHWLDIGELEYIRREDKNLSEINSRISAYEASVNEQLANTDSNHRVKAFITMLFK